MSKLPPGWSHEEPSTRALRPLAAQLFPAQELMKSDLPDTLSRIKAAGYDGVEFFGGLDWTAQYVRKALDDAGLHIAGWHTPWHYLSPSNIYSTISYNKILGNQYLIVPWMPDEALHTTIACLQFSKVLSRVADTLACHDMLTGYHNHATEFRPTDDTGQLPWDIIATNTPSTVIMQTDIGNGLAGGGDMINLLKKYPGRSGTIHVKPHSDASSDTFFDDPNCNINWEEYFDICRNSAGVRWYIIEYLNDARFPGDPIAGLAAAAKWFRGYEGS